MSHRGRRRLPRPLGRRPGPRVAPEALEPRCLLNADFTLQILHASDLEAGIAAIDDAPRFAAVIDRLEETFANTVILSSGDNYIPGPFFNAGGDPALNAVLGGSGTASVGRADIEIMNRIGFQSSAFGNHEFDAGPREVRNIILPAGNWRGAQFPYLSANLDFAGDPDLGPSVRPAGQEAGTIRGRIAPSTVITVGGQRIGIVGATTPLLRSISSPGTGIVVRPPDANDLAALAAIIQTQVDALEATGINKIIVTSHLQQIGLEQQLAPLLSGVDVIIAGGSNTRLADATDRLRAGEAAQGPYPILTTNADGQPLAIVNTDGNFKYVGRLVAVFDAAGVLEPANLDPAVNGAYAADDQGVLDLWGDLTAPFAAGTKGAAVREVTQAVAGVINTQDSIRFGRTDVYLNGLRTDVRTQETNLGDITADANLATARSIDPTVLVSIKNGGGIRDSIGSIDAETGVRRPPAANPSAGKAEGDVSQLDVANSLRFNNQLSLITVSAQGLRRILEHSVAATAPGATPGQFPQVGGLSFSFDTTRQPIVLAGNNGTGAASVVTEGQRVRNLAIVDEAGTVLDVIVRDGQLVGDPARPIRVVTLNFLIASSTNNGLGGDNYPFQTFGTGRLDLGIGEQTALADYLSDRFPIGGTAFSLPDTGPAQDTRIQNLAARADAVLPPGLDRGIRLQPIGTIGVPGAEIAAHDPRSQRVFVTRGPGIEILSISDPTRPSRVATADLSAFGAGVSSVAVRDGLVAAAVFAEPRTAPGRVVFLNADGAVLGSVTVGALPDQLTYTPDGARVLVANEGEALDIENQAVDNPEGSVSVITVNRTNPSASAVQTAGFGAYNARRAELLAAGVRIFATSPTVAQDLEPEFIAVAPDGLTALVTLQEANAVAVLDVLTATITDIRPLGLKDYSRDLVALETYTLTDRPSIGTTAAGDSIPLGGFSGLAFEGINPANGRLRFLTHTDRGPNAEPLNVDGDQAIERPFALPGFQPRLIRFELDRASGTLTITQQIGLTRQDGSPLTGLPNLRIGPSTSDNAPFNDEEGIDLFNNPLPLDPLGADLEGIAIAADGTFWMADEYRPALYHFDAAGRLIERLVPQGTAAAAGQPAGTFGTESLPAVLGQRRANRGFEGIAIQGGRVYGFVQSTIRNPATLSNANLNALRNIRIVEFNPADGQVRQFLYIQDAGSDRIGDVVASGNGEFLVIERDDDSIFTAGSPAIDKRVYRISLAGATNVHGMDAPINGLTIDQMTAAQLAAAGIVPVSKTLRVDLAAAGYNRVEKVEGLALIDANTLVVLNDEDFGLEGTFNPTTGRLTPNPTPEPIILGILRFQTNGLDSSDRDGGIVIRPQPVSGLFQPDGIASFSANGQTYYITANEGDTRDEDRRIGAANFPALDPTAYPNAAALRQNAVLGRLNASPIDGDTDGDGDIDRLTTYGGRSFSILDASGRRIFDSGDLLERLTAQLTPALFNANNGDPAAVDTRSDDKGPEPEGVVVGVVDGRLYAFVGLERGPGGVVVFDVTDPFRPVFLQQIARAGDISPEGLAFVPAASSPTGRPLLIVSNEVSQTVTIYQILAATTANDPPGAAGDAFATDEDTPLVVAAPGLLGNDSDGEGAALRPILVAGPSSGTLLLNADGSFTYTPAANFQGTDQFTYRVTDGTTVSDVATVTLTVGSVNDAPAAVADAFTLAEDTSLTIPAPGVLGNDADADGDALSAVLVAGPTNGALTFNANGSFVYTPNAGFNGTDGFTYRASDGTADSGLAAVTLTVGSVNDAPAAVADAFTLAEDTPLTVAAPGVLGNDADTDGDALTAVLVAGPTNGALTFNADGSFVYTPSANFRGTDRFTYRVSDGSIVSDVASVTLTVGSVNDAPAAIADAFTLAEDTSLTIPAPGVLGNDADADGDAMTAVLVAGPTNGALTFNANGSFVYTPNAGFNGTDRFTYRASDGTADSGLAAVTLTVTGVVDIPASAADSFATPEETPLVVSAPGVLANDGGGDGPLTASLVTGPARGRLVFNADGSFAYTPDPDFSGVVSFTYRVGDGTSAGNVATATIVVTPVPDLPRASGVPVAAVVGLPLDQVVVATFVDPDPLGATSVFTATIDWGDGTAVTAGTVVLVSSPAAGAGDAARFEVRGSHIYLAVGTFPIRVTIGDPAGGSVTATATASVAPLSVGLTGGLTAGSDSGVSNSDGITNVASPTFTGTAPAGFLVTVTAAGTGGAPIVVGQAIAGPDGIYRITSSPLADGSYALTATAANPAVPGAPPLLSASLGTVVIDTLGPRVVEARLGPRGGRVLLTFADDGVGLDRSSLRVPALYSIRRAFAGRSLGLGVTGVQVADAAEARTARVFVTVLVRGGRRIRPGRYVVSVASGSGGVTDAAGNALDGEFRGVFPTGDGRPGGDFRARLDVTGRGTVPAGPVALAIPAGPAGILRRGRRRP